MRARLSYLSQGQQLSQDRAMVLGGPLGQDGVEQDLTDPFADLLIAGELLDSSIT
jgi:hypothetical protein